MLFSNITPFIRFAKIIHYKSEGDPVYVRDCRIFYILGGEAKLCIDNQTYILKPHTVFYCCGGSRYAISSSGVDLITLNFDLTQEYCHRERSYSPLRISKAVSLPPPNSCFIEDHCILNQHVVLENATVCRKAMDEILGEFSKQKILYRETASALLKSLLVQLLRGKVENASQTARAVEMIIDHIHANYNTSMSNALFSQLTGYHEYYLNRIFAKHTGYTIRRYILDVRVNHAIEFLLNTDYPISVIAEKVGFNSDTYFSTYFRQLTGTSPAQFRKKNKNMV